MDFGVQSLEASYHGRSAGPLEYQNALYSQYDTGLSHGMIPPPYLQHAGYVSDVSKQPGLDNSIRPSPPASPSTFSHSYGHPPSTISTASGPSAQSTGSSAGGSPRTSMGSQIPPQAKWPDSMTGLNIGPGIVGNDLGLQDPYASDEFQQNMAMCEPKYQGFVGTYEILFSALCYVSCAAIRYLHLHALAATPSCGDATP